MLHVNMLLFDSILQLMSPLLLARGWLRQHIVILEMWALAQRDGRPTEYRWRPLLNAAKFGLMPTTRMSCSNAAKMRNTLKFAGVPQTRQQISAASRPKFTILSEHVGETLLFNKFFSDCQYVP